MSAIRYFAQMDIIAKLQTKHNKEVMLAIRDFVIANPKQVEVLMDCFFSDNLQLCQRSSWPIMHIGLSKPQLISPYLIKMVERLPTALHDAQIRNTVRILEELGTPEEVEGEVFELCFGYLVDPKRATAIRAFSITVLVAIAEKHPELKHELKSELQFQKDHGSVGFKNRVKNTLKKL